MCRAWYLRRVRGRGARVRVVADAAATLLPRPRPALLGRCPAIPCTRQWSVIGCPTPKLASVPQEDAKHPSRLDPRRVIECARLSISLRRTTFVIHSRVDAAPVHRTDNEHPEVPTSESEKAAKLSLKAPLSGTGRSAEQVGRDTPERDYPRCDCEDRGQRSGRSGGQFHMWICCGDGPRKERNKGVNSCSDVGIAQYVPVGD